MMTQCVKRARIRLVACLAAVPGCVTPTILPHGSHRLRLTVLLVLVALTAGALPAHAQGVGNTGEMSLRHQTYNVPRSVYEPPTLLELYPELYRDSEGNLRTPGYDVFRRDLLGGGMVAGAGYRIHAAVAAQAFTTGTNPGGYKIDQVVFFIDYPTDGSRPTKLSASIRNGVVGSFILSTHA